MPSTRSAVFALVVSVASAGGAAAGPMLTGTVTYDPASRLYTYSYTLDDRAAVAPIDQIYIRVATGRHDLTLRPSAHAEPAPFRLATYTGGGWPDAPDFPPGTLFGWNAARVWDTLTPGVRTGFSFTTPYGPTAETTDNYSLFSKASTLPPHDLQEGHLEYGRVVAPDITRTPEPATLGLAGVGLLGLWVRCRLRRSAG